jgi:hypothetical protein
VLERFDRSTTIRNDKAPRRPRSCGQPGARIGPDRCSRLRARWSGSGPRSDQKVQKKARSAYARFSPISRLPKRAFSIPYKSPFASMLAVAPLPAASKSADTLRRAARVTLTQPGAASLPLQRKKKCIDARPVPLFAQSSSAPSAQTQRNAGCMPAACGRPDSKSGRRPQLHDSHAPGLAAGRFVADLIAGRPPDQYPA